MSIIIKGHYSVKKSSTLKSLKLLYCNGVTKSVYCGIILPIRYTGTLNENTGISLYHSSPVFYTRTACLTHINR